MAVGWESLRPDSSFDGMSAWFTVHLSAFEINILSN
jgi:hypothetical protein